MTRAINFEAGQTKRIIAADQGTDQPYIARVTGPNDLIIESTKQYSDEGNLLRAGQRHKLTKITSDEVYATAVDGTTSLVINPAVADVEAQAERVVEIDGDVSISGLDNIDVSDRQGRKIGKARLMDSDGVLIDPATGDVSAEQPREVETWNAGTLPVDAGTARKITEWTAGILSVEAAAGPITDQTTTTGASNAAELQLGQRSQVDVAYDLSATATVTVEASSDGSTWRQREQISTDGEGTILINCAFEYVRAYADSNLNSIEIGAKK